MERLVRYFKRIGWRRFARWDWDLWYSFLTGPFPGSLQEIPI